MHDLLKSHCEKITAQTIRMDDKEIDQYMAMLTGWKKFQHDGELRLEKMYKFNDFALAAAFTAQIAQMAEEEDHHPAILTEWGKVTVTWWTHKIKGLHRNDFIMAAKTDDFYEKEYAI